MSESTNISWATHTASPWFGCSKVSPGCTNCYAEQLTLQKGWAGWGDNSPRVKSKGFWKDAYRYNLKAQDTLDVWHTQPVTTEEPERPRMFTSLMDFLDRKAPTEWRAQFLKVVYDCQNLDWLLLTKRPENFAVMMEECQDWFFDYGARNCAGWLSDWRHGRRLPENIWFGVTVENQEMADKRIPELCKVPARIRWLSVEPLLEPVELGLMGTLPKDIAPNYTTLSQMIHWVVVGGESGKNRRDCGVNAIMEVVEECTTMDVPVYVKQDCAAKSGQQGRIPDPFWDRKEYPLR